MENYAITTEAQSITGAINENDQMVDKIEITGITFDTPGEYNYDPALHERLKNDIANDAIIRCIGIWNIVFSRDWMDTSVDQNPSFNYIVNGNAYTAVFKSDGKCTVSYYEPHYSIYCQGLNLWEEGTYSSSPELFQTFANAWKNNNIVGLRGTSGKAIVINMSVDAVDSPSSISLVYIGIHPYGNLKTIRTVINSTNAIVKELNNITFDEPETFAMNVEQEGSEIIIFK